MDIGALIQGPVYIGLHCTINPGAKLRRNISLGPNCKIGGELEDVIFQGYGNHIIMLRVLQYILIQ